MTRLPEVGLPKRINQFRLKYRVREGLSVAIEAALLAGRRGSSRSNDLRVLAKHHVGRFWRGHVLGASVTKLEHVDIREELLAGPEEDR